MMEITSLESREMIWKTEFAHRPLFVIDDDVDAVGAEATIRPSNGILCNEDMWVGQSRFMEDGWRSDEKNFRNLSSRNVMALEHEMAATIDNNEKVTLNNYVVVHHGNLIAAVVE